MKDSLSTEAGSPDGNFTLGQLACLPDIIDVLSPDAKF
jgi:hypothetical protein